MARRPELACKGAKGNTLTMFVGKYPEKKAYFELSNETMKRFLGAWSQVLVGEQLPISSSIWKVAGLGLAYVAQHVFDHPEKHMQKVADAVWSSAGARMIFDASPWGQHLILGEVNERPSGPGGRG